MSTASEPGVTCETPHGEGWRVESVPPGHGGGPRWTFSNRVTHRPFLFVADSSRGSLRKQVMARVKMTQASEPPEASGRFSGGGPPTLVCREAAGHEGRLGSLENFLFQERQPHRTYWTISKAEGAQKGGK